MDDREVDSMFRLESDYWWYRALHELVCHHVARERGRRLRILDAGCGTGRMMQLLSAYGDVEGLDAGALAVALAQGREGNRVIRADLNSWVHEALYDVVVSLDVISDAGVKDDRAVLQRLHGALREGGLLILNVPAFEVLRRGHDEAVSTDRRYRRGPLGRFLIELGFSIERITYRLPALFGAILGQKIFHRLFGRRVERPRSDLRPLPSWLNGVLSYLARLENRLLEKGVPLPFGSSLFVVARKGPAPNARPEDMSAWRGDSAGPDGAGHESTRPAAASAASASPGDTAPAGTRTEVVPMAAEGHQELGPAPVERRASWARGGSGAGRDR